MPTPCIFCDNNSGSREHIWPDWILKRRNFGPIRHKVGERPEKILPNPELTVASVCGACNKGWMSRLEGENKPIVGLMFDDIAIPLDVQQQTSVSVWAIKTAMVIDSVQGRNPANRFYRKPEGEVLHLNREIPARTRIWLGRSEVSSLRNAGTHLRMFSPEIPARTSGMATTVVAGHLAIQVITLHVHPEFVDRGIPDPEPKPGDWDNLLTQIWPIDLQYVNWPPRASFTRSGQNSILTLANRWRGGEEVPVRMLKT